jgi:hypothetical protein
MIQLLAMAPLSFFGVAALWGLSLAGALRITEEHALADATVLLQSAAAAQEENDSSDEVHVAFVLDCRPFNLWQHEMLFHSARLVGQRGPITAIISGCADEEKAHYQERHKAWNFPAQFTQYFVPKLNDHRSDWLSKPFGVQHWYTNLGPERDIVAVVDPDFIFVTPLTAKLDTSKLPLDWKGPIPSRVQRGIVAAQRYNIFPPFTGDYDPFRLTLIGLSGSEHNMSEEDFLNWVCSGDTNGASGCTGLTKYEFGTFHGSGVPYIAHRDDWDWIANDWASITERLHKYAPEGCLVDMWSWMLANAHKGRRQFIMPNLMLSDYRVPDFAEDWSGVDASRVDLCGTDLQEVIPKVRNQIPSFMHYCQTIRVPYESFKSQDGGALFSKYWFDWHQPSGKPHVLERCQQTERSPQVGIFPAMRWIKSAPPRVAMENDTITTRERRSRFMGCAVKAFFRSAVQASCSGQPLAKEVLEERDPSSATELAVEMDRIIGPLLKALRRRPEYGGEYLAKNDYLGEITIGFPNTGAERTIVTMTRSSTGSHEFQAVADELVPWNISQETISKIFEDAKSAPEHEVTMQ